MTGEIHALSARQERRLVEYLDERFLTIMRAHRMRSQPTSNLPTLSSYLDAMHEVLSLILQIPPVPPSAALRVAYLLRFIGDALSSVPGYEPDANSMRKLLDWMDDVDQACVCVLRNQVWNPSSRTEDDPDVQMSDERSSPLSQTDRIRLHSLLVGGQTTLEEWLSGAKKAFEEPRAYDRLNNLFSKTLQELGALDGIVVNAGE